MKNPKAILVSECCGELLDIHDNCFYCSECGIQIVDKTLSIKTLLRRYEDDIVDLIMPDVDMVVELLNFIKN